MKCHYNYSKGDTKPLQTGYKEGKEVPVFEKWFTERPIEHHLDHTTGSFCKLKKEVHHYSAVIPFKRVRSTS